jgi:methyl-accepting chemotaxis protein
MQKMEQTIREIGSVSQETVGAMDMIFTEIKSMNLSFAVVSQSVEDQSAGSAQMLTALETVQDMTKEVQDGAERIHQRTKAIQNEMTKLHTISQEVTESVHTMRKASQSLTEFLEAAHGIAEKS